MTPNLSYEKAFERLEQILEQMNSGKTALDDSIKLYEEAEKLLSQCTKALNSAEKKIEQLIKGRNGEIAVDAEKQPRTEPFAQAQPKMEAKMEPKIKAEQLPF